MVGRHAFVALLLLCVKKQVHPLVYFLFVIDHGLDGNMIILGSSDHLPLSISILLSSMVKGELLLSGLLWAVKRRRGAERIWVVVG